MRFAQHVVPDAPDFKNRTLGRLLAPDASAGIAAKHRALDDARITSLVFRACLARYREGGGADDIGALLRFVAAPVLVRVMPYGRYRGKRIAAVPDAYLASIVAGERFAGNGDLRYSAEVELTRRRELQPQLAL
jgi:exodeoxyribonuclease X